MTGDDLISMLNEMASELVDARDEPQALERALVLAVQNVPGCDSASVILVRGRGAAVIPDATSEPARRAAELQYELDEGPGLDAVDDQLGSHSGDLAADPRWPVWGPKVASELHLHSMLCLRLFTRGRVYGALNLYGHQRQAFTHEAQIEAEALATMAAVAIASQREIHGLQVAVVGRTVIGQAQGILMERYGIDADQAFAFLARLSSSLERPVRKVAEDIIRTRQVPEIPRRNRSPEGTS